MARRGAGKQRPNRMNRLPVAPNDSADIALTQLHFKDCRFAAWNFREHHLVGKFNQLANNELEKFFHDDLEDIPNTKFVTSRVVATVPRLRDRRVFRSRLDRARRLQRSC
jgi:hypothetical protein